MTYGQQITSILQDCELDRDEKEEAIHQTTVKAIWRSTHPILETKTTQNGQTMKQDTPTLGNISQMVAAQRKARYASEKWAHLYDPHLLTPEELAAILEERERWATNFRKLERENAELRAANARLHGDVDLAYATMNETNQDLAALREDKARLDWLEESQMLWEGKDWLRGPEFITRAAIDAARKEETS